MFTFSAENVDIKYSIVMEVNNWNESTRIKKIEKQNNPNVMNLL